MMPVSTKERPLLEVVDLHKSYGETEILKGIDMTFKAGEIHAFLGANGAGKSTFLGCLSGAVIPSKGHILFDGEDHKSFTPREALSKGIGIIYQHFQVFEGLTVAENIFLGQERRKMFITDASTQNAEAKKLLERLGVHIDPRTPLEHLSTGERKIVEIARALSANPKLLILDEPTAAIGEAEMKILHDVVRQVAHKQGLGVIYVTHLLDEIEQIADKVTVLRNGQIVWTKDEADVQASDLAAAIAPSSTTQVAAADVVQSDAVPILELEGFSSPFTGPIDLSVRPGEAIGVYGLLGSGRTDFLEGLFGARPQTAGTLKLNGQVVRIKNPAHAIDLGISLVASDRSEQSLFRALSATENLLMPHFGRRLMPSKMRNRRLENSLFADVAEKLSVQPPNPNLAASHFSGGNAQKIVLGRWLLEEDVDGKVLLLDEPTQGVDIGARAQLYQTLRMAMKKGAAVVFASSDPGEIITLANRVLVLGYGTPVALIDKPKSEGELVELAHKTASGLQSA